MGLITKMWRDIGRKLRFFPPNSYLVSPEEGVTLELGNGAWAQNTRLTLPPDRKIYV